MSNKNARTPKSISPSSANRAIHLNGSAMKNQQPNIKTNNTPAPKPKPLPPIPKKREKKASKHQMEEDWWALSGKMLAKYGQKAWDYGIQILSGFGDYELETNSLVAAATKGMNGSSVPIIFNGKAANIVRHREYIKDVFGTTDNFSIEKFSVNPGLDKTFPWASTLSGCYTNYRLRGAVFEFVSLATDYSAVPYIGYVAMASNYNALAKDFTSKKEMENSEYASSGKPSNNLCHPIECAKGQLSLDELYIRKGALPSNSDIRLYDLCNFFIATGGQAQSGIIGELWITYELEFYFPVLSSSEAGNINACVMNSTAISPTNPLGTTLAVASGNTFTPIGMTTTAWTMPPECYGQKFILTCTWTGATGVTPVPPTFAVGANRVTLLNTVSGYTGGLANQTSLVMQYFFLVGPDTAICSFGTSGTFPAGANALLIVLDQLPYGVAEDEFLKQRSLQLCNNNSSCHEDLLTPLSDSERIEQDIAFRNFIVDEIREVEKEVASLSTIPTECDSLYYDRVAYLKALRKRLERFDLPRAL